MASKGRFLRLDKLQNQNTNKGKRKSDEEERRRRGKSNGCTLSFYNGCCGFCRIKTVGHKKVHLAVTFSKIRLDIHFVIRNRPYVAVSSGLVNVKETFFKRISCKIVPETSSK